MYRLIILRTLSQDQGKFNHGRPAVLKKEQRKNQLGKGTYYFQGHQFI